MGQQTFSVVHSVQDKPKGCAEETMLRWASFRRTASEGETQAGTHIC